MYIFFSDTHELLHSRSKYLKKLENPTQTMSQQDALLRESLEKFYSEPHNQERLYNTLNGEEGISLRSIDWFITNYSKKNNIYYQIYKDKIGIPTFDETGEFSSNMSVHHSYKSQLKAYSKKRFDPFCRRDRLTFSLGDYGTIETTIGQLNFFRWAIKNHIVEYISKYVEQIEIDMNESLQATKKFSQKKGRKSRQELSKSALRGLNKNKLSVCITFD